MTASRAKNGASGAFGTFDIEIDGIVHDVYRYDWHDSAQQQQARARILMFPDFAGAATHGAARLASAYGNACGAEVLLTDLYGKADKPDGYDHRADSVIRHARANPHDTQRHLLDMLAALAPHWRANGPVVSAGFCFGGSLAFELARADRSSTISAAVSIHGDPSTKAPIGAGITHAEFIMIHGGSDPLIPPESISAFTREADAARLRWQLIVLGHARHGFTKQEMTGSNQAMRYDAHADEVARRYVAAYVAAIAGTHARKPL